MGNQEDQGAEVLATHAIFSESWRIYKGNFWLLSLIALALLIPAQIVVLLTRGTVFSLLPVGTVASAWLIGAVTLAVASVIETGREDRTAFRLIGAVWPKLFWLSLLYVVVAIGIAFGLFLLIVPGVILALRWFVAMPMMMVEGPGLFDSMWKSSQLTHGRREKIFWTALILFLLSAPLIVIGFLTRSVDPEVLAGWRIVSDAVVNSFSTVVIVVVYFRLVRLKESSELES